MYTIPVRFVSTYDYFLKVCVQFPTSADNVTLLASAADRRAAAAPLCWAPAAAAPCSDRSISPACPHGAQRHNATERVMDGTDGRKDNGPLHSTCLIMRAVSVTRYSYIYIAQGCSGAGTPWNAVPANIVGHRWNANTEAFWQIAPKRWIWHQKSPKIFRGCHPRIPLAGGGEPLPHLPPTRLHAVRGGASSPVAGT